ncbi:hypothetical protein CIP100629_02401 [Corynebacterium diphtheriae]|nr:hypothetical protein CIP100629_02401 [Corynebacterium diphtheriae]
MHDTGLHHGIRPGCLHGFRQAFEPVAADDEHVLDPTVGKVSAHGCPKTGAFIVCDPQSQDVLDAVHVDAYRHVARLVDHAVAIADLHSQRIEEDHWVELVELAVLPDHDLF